MFDVGLVYGCSRLFITDMGSEWCNTLMDEICHLLASRATRPPPMTRRVWPLTSALHALNVGDAWDMALPVVTFVRNQRYTKPNGGTRFEHFFG